MFRKPLLIAALIVAISACTTNEIPIEPVTKNEIHDRLSLMEETLTENFIKVCKDDELEVQKQRAINAELTTDLSKSTKRLISAQSELATLRKGCRAKEPEEPEQSKESKVSTGKLLLGEIEDVFLIDQDVTLEARIDTGAETSSLGVFKLTKFERDGKDWVKFSLKSSKKAPSYEYPVHDDVRIKQREEDGSEARFEIELDIKVGKKKYRKQLFNLSSRRHYDFQVLIGRSFLRDIAVVDVGKKHQLKRK